MTARQYATAKRMWAEGATTRRIAEAIGATFGAVAGMMMRHRDDFPRRTMTLEDKATVACLWAKGATVADIAQATGRDSEAIEAFASRHRDMCPAREGRTDGEGTGDGRRVLAVRE